MYVDLPTTTYDPKEPQKKTNNTRFIYGVCIKHTYEQVL